MKASNEFYPKSKLPPYLRPPQHNNTHNNNNSSNVFSSSTTNYNILANNTTTTTNNDIIMDYNTTTATHSKIGNDTGTSDSVLEKKLSRLKILESDPNNVVSNNHNNHNNQDAHNSDQADMAAGGGGGMLYNKESSSSNNIVRSISARTLSYPSLSRLHSQQQQQQNAEKQMRGTTSMEQQHHNQMLPQQKNSDSINYNKIQPTWRLKERVKTVGVSLVLALNIGTDPPDIQRTSPCAKLQCWIDPTSMSRSKAREMIGETLETQYSKWQQRAKLRYKRALDPTVDDVRSLCITMRRHAKGERVLLHYNGHGVPRPTSNGEIWVFDKDHTQYIPLSVGDLRQWMGKPSILVLDCSGAGIVMPFLMSDAISGTANTTPNSNVPIQQQPNKIMGFSSSNASYASTANNSCATTGIEYDSIVLAPCSAGEWLPQNPEFPADIFTSCLTTPIPMALRWFVYQNPLSMGFIFGTNSTSNCSNTNNTQTTGSVGTPNGSGGVGGAGNTIDPMQQVDKIPGQLSDRKTPLGELNWIFAAITDTIAWNVLPSALFQRLFRQDLLVAGLFRNFLLAVRILSSLNCTPVSNPPMPEGTEHHPLWQAWDLAVETCLFRLVKEGVLGSNGTSCEGGKEREEDAFSDGRMQQQQPQSMSFFSKQQQSQQSQKKQTKPIPTTPKTNILNSSSSITSPFFAEQLTAFEIWLDYALSRGNNNNYNMVIESPPEQLPVVLQVLLSQAHRVRALTLLNRFLDLGPFAINLALSVGIFPYVLKLLNSHVDEYKHVLIGIWAKILSFDPSCQVDLVKDGALPHFIAHLNWGLSSSPSSQSQNGSVISSIRTEEDKTNSNMQRIMAAFILSVVTLDYPLGQTECLRQNLHGSCVTLLSNVELQEQELQEQNQQQQNNSRIILQRILTPEYRMWICICLGNLSRDCVSAQSELLNSGLHTRLYKRLMNDCCSNVRASAAYALGCFIGGSYGQQQDDIPLYSMSSTASGTATSSNTSPTTRMGTTISPASLSFYPGGISVHPPTNMPPQNQSHYNSIEGSENNNRMSFDILIGKRLLESLDDASTTVRYEVIVALACLVHKYLMVFAAIAVEGALSSSSSPKTTKGNATSPSSSNNQGATANDSNNSTTTCCITMPSGIDRIKVEEFNKIWLSLKHVQRQDPHPGISTIANSIVSYAHERIVLVESRYRDVRVAQRQQQQQQQQSSSHQPPYLDGVKEDNESHSGSDGTPATYHRSRSSGAVMNMADRNSITPSPTPSLLSQTLHHHNHSNTNTNNNTHHLPQNAEFTNDSSISIPGKIRRNMSALSSAAWYTSGSTNTPNTTTSAATAAPRRQSDNMYNLHSSSPDSFVSFELQQGHPNLNLNETTQPFKYNHEFTLPKSKFYEWKRLEFTNNFKSRSSSSNIVQQQQKEYNEYYHTDEDDEDEYDEEEEDDPLSPTGAMKVYRELRNQHIHDQSFALSSYYQMLVPNYHHNHHTMHTSSIFSSYNNSNNSSFSSPYNNNNLNKEYDDDADSVVFMDNEEKAAAEAAFEAQITAKKRTLRLSQSALLQNDGVESTSLLRFHAYEPVLVVCDRSDGVSIWDTRDSTRLNTFCNGNPKKSRITSVLWMNEMSSNSLLMTASDDGTVRVWEDLFNHDYGSSNNTSSTTTIMHTNTSDSNNTKPPTLRNAFSAAPELQAGQRGSGLVLEWQQYSGNLIAAGNSPYIRCWDVQAEKCYNQFDRKSNACVTCITTAWDSLLLGPNASNKNTVQGDGYSGIGPNIVVAGYGDGSVKVFDIRTSSSISSYAGSSNTSYHDDRDVVGESGRRRRQPKLMQYAEHSSWIVDMFFTAYGVGYEVVSGCVGGDIKFHDLRYSSSLRTIDVQRSPMTAFAIHPRVPLIATGSHAQFIKIFTLADGDTLDVIRYHDEIHHRRIGPVSNLAFHPHKLMLASGATDEIVSLYEPRNTSSFAM